MDQALGREHRGLEWTSCLPPDSQMLVKEKDQEAVTMCHDKNKERGELEEGHPAQVGRENHGGLSGRERGQVSLNTAKVKEGGF